MSPVLADPALYAEVYRSHISYVRSILVNLGCPSQQLDDVASEVLIKIMDHDGLAKYDPSRSSLRTYLWAFVTRAAKTILARKVWAWEARRAVLEDDYAATYTQTSGEEFEAFLSQLMGSTEDEDARYFIQIASESTSYDQARSQLVSQGWESNRIRRAVRRARTGIRVACLN